MPLLYIQGVRDRVIPSDIVEQMKRLRPQLQVHRADAAHLVLQTRPKECAEVISRFVRSACFEAG
jgi:pimeloyl-ACP methyl ester carboxylesterase